MVTDDGSVVCPWNATTKRSLITCVVALHPHPGVTIVIVATTGTNTVVPSRTGASYRYETDALGWLVDVEHTHLQSFSLYVASSDTWFATGAAAKPTGDRVTIYL